jgi:hypothetical protein
MAGATRVKTKYLGIYRRGDVYLYIWRDAHGKQRSATAPTLKERVTVRRLASWKRAAVSCSTSGASGSRSTPASGSRPTAAGAARRRSARTPVWPPTCTC